MTVLSSYWPVMIFGAIVVLVLVWPRRRPLDLAPPRCFGSAPGPQERAENDCETCPFADRCLR